MKPALAQRQNAFLAFADRSMSWSVKKKVRAAAKRTMHAAQKKAVIKAVNERGLLMRLWKRWRLDLFNAALEGPYQNDIQQLINILKRITLKEERKLISIVRKGPWLAAHKDIQFLVLRLIDAQLIALREKADLPPFDDALWGEPLTPFQIIRNHFLEKTHAG